MLTAQQLTTMENMATANGIEFAALRAFCEVEAGNQIFAKVRGRDMPLIRWEGHYFDRLVKASLRALARAKGLASTKVGEVKNPTSQEARYDLLDKAKAIDYDAAVMSTSWGFGQVMGEHWQLFKMQSAKEFEKVAVSGFEGQLKLIILFLINKGVTRHIANRDWAAVARIYNGAQYAKNKYDIKLAAAYAKYAKATGAVGLVSEVPTVVNTPATPVGMLRVGSKGPSVRELQTLLVRAGYTVKVDGDFGESTETAIQAFQTANGLDVDGFAGPKTMAALNAYRVAPNEKLATTPALAVNEVRSSVPGILGSFGVAGLKDQIVNLSDQLSLVNNDTATHLANYLQVGATVIGIGLAAYAIYGWWKASRNTRGIEDRDKDMRHEMVAQGVMNG